MPLQSKTSELGHLSNEQGDGIDATECGGFFVLFFFNTENYSNLSVNLKKTKFSAALLKKK